MTKIIFILSLICIQAQSQCKIDNKFFDAGEELTMDLYFKYGLIHMKAGTSSLKTSSDKYNNTNAYKISLLAQSSGAVRKIFNLDDTLTSYMTKSLEPLAFVKRAHEGEEYTKEDVAYDYDAKGVNIHAKRIRNGELRFDKKLTAKSCIYDMLSVVIYARTLDYSKMKYGDATKVNFLSGDQILTMEINYQGIEKVEANDKKNYDCIKLILNISSPAFADKKEAMRVYITNDQNQMPVRLDSKLKIGSTRAILRSYKGNKHPVKSN